MRSSKEELVQRTLLHNALEQFFPLQHRRNCNIERLKTFLWEDPNIFLAVHSADTLQLISTARQANVPVQASSDGRFISWVG